MKKLKDLIKFYIFYIPVTLLLLSFTSIGEPSDGYIKVRKDNDTTITIYSTIPYRFVNKKDTINVKDFKEKKFIVHNNDYTFVVE